MRLDLADEIEVDDRRAVNSLEATGIEALLQILHRLAQDERVVAGVDAHIIARQVKPHTNGECFLVLDSGAQVKVSRSYREVVARFVH
jgi:hypothetical protein